MADEAQQRPVPATVKHTEWENFGFKVETFGIPNQLVGMPPVIVRHVTFATTDETEDITFKLSDKGAAALAKQLTRAYVPTAREMPQG